MIPKEALDLLLHMSRHVKARSHLIEDFEGHQVVRRDLTTINLTVKPSGIHYHCMLVHNPTVSVDESVATRRQYACRIMIQTRLKASYVDS